MHRLSTITGENNALPLFPLNWLVNLWPGHQLSFRSWFSQTDLAGKSYPLLPLVPISAKIPHALFAVIFLPPVFFYRLYLIILNDCEGREKTPLAKTLVTLASKTKQKTPKTTRKKCAWDISLDRSNLIDWLNSDEAISYQSGHNISAPKVCCSKPANSQIRKM